MELISVNVSRPRELVRGDRVEVTAIDKLAADGPVAVTALGLEGDEVADTRHHGGPDQAIYVYTTEDLAFFEDELGRAIRPGTFGENLTISGTSSRDLVVGDRLQVGDDVLLEVTAPRVPCGTFAHQMQERAWVKRFLEAGRPGAYCRVLQPGSVAAGDAIVLDAAADRSLPVPDMLRLAVDRNADLGLIRAALERPIAARAREDYEERLATG